MPWVCPACAGINPDGTRFCGHCGAALAADAAPLRDERRLVTAVFADVAGFSGLAGRLDPERVQEIIDPVIGALSDVVGRYGGTIEKFAGDAVMALFGAPLAHDDDAVRAVHVALEMHRDLAGVVPRLPADGAGLALHIGVNSGHGVARLVGGRVRLDYGVVGDVVVLAQRLESVTPVGETYVGTTTRDLARREFEFEAVGPLRVKGRAEPLPAWRLLGPRRSFAVAPATPALVGRERELAAIAEFTSGRQGGGAIFVTGEAGLGKSVLCQAVRGLLPERTWAATRCLPYGGGFAYWPFAELIRNLYDLGSAEADLLEARLAAAGLQEELPFLANLCGIEAEQPALTGEALQRRLRAAVVTAVLRRCEEAPLTVLFDDLHWADEPTVGLLGELLTASADAPLLMLVTSRPEGEARVDGLAEALPSLRLELRPLGGEAVAEVAGRILGGEPGAPLLEALLEHTAGNPFFVEEVTRSLLDRGALVDEDGRWRSRAAWDEQHVPVTVEGVIAARVDALAAADRASLEVLAVVGRRADVRIARALQPDLDRSLPALVRAGLLDPLAEEGSVAVFHHPVTQQVVYSRLVRLTRADLHRRAGEAAEALYGSGEAAVERLARHFYLGEDRPKAYQYLLRASERAERLFANEQAIGYIVQALEVAGHLGDRDAVRPGLLLRRARLEELRGAFADAVELYRQVVEADGDIAAIAGLASTLAKLGRYREGLTEVRAARSRPNVSPRDQALLASEEAQLLGSLGQNAQSAAVFQEALTAVAGTDDTLESEILMHLARTEQSLGEPDLAYEHGSRARRMLEQAGNAPRLATALRILGGVMDDLEEDGRPRAETSVELLERAHSVARRVGSAEEMGATLINLGVVLRGRGRSEEAIEKHIAAAAAFESIGLQGGIAAAYSNLAECLQDLGRVEEALAAARTALDAAEEIGQLFWITGALNGIAQAELRLGHPDEALAAAERASEIAGGAQLADRRRWALRYAAQAHAALGDSARAQELEELAERIL